MVCDLTGMDIANASLLDEATAAAEAMTLSYGSSGSDTRNLMLISADCHPQTISVIRTRARALDIDVRVEPRSDLAPDHRTFAVLLQYPGTDGELRDPKPEIEAAQKAGALAIVATDLLALTLVKPPGEMGADIVIGSAQRFGVPMGYGGPHAAFFACKDALKRRMPGRIVGVSRDSRGRVAYRLTLQTREQHIRREKATSNICTAQALLANMAAMCAIFHGPERLRKIGNYVHQMCCLLAEGAKQGGHTVEHDHFLTQFAFDATPNTRMPFFKGLRKQASTSGNWIARPLPSHWTKRSRTRIWQIFMSCLELLSKRLSKTLKI